MNTWRRRRSSGWPRLLVGWLARGLALARVAVEVAAQALRGHRARRANAGRGGRGERGGGRRRRVRGPAYLVLRSNDLDAFYCTPPEQRKDPSKPGGDASDERKRAILSRSGRARRKLACNDTRCPKPAARDETTPHRAPSRRRATQATKSHRAAPKRREISLHR